MRPIKFAGANRTYVGAPGSEDIDPLPAMVVEYSDGQRAIISCWRPSPLERVAIFLRGRVFLHVMGTAQPPVYVGTERPEAA